MRDGLGDLGLRQAIVHPDRDVAGQLRHLTIGDQSADRDQTAVARRQVWTQPQVAEQNVGRVLHDAGEHCAELIADALRAISLGGLVERQQRGRGRRKLVRPDIALGEYVLGDSDRANRVRPTGVERQMRDDLRKLRRLHAVVERKLQVIPQRDRLIAPDQRRDRDDAAIAREKAGALPHLAEQAILRILVERRRNHLNVLAGGAFVCHRAGGDRERQGQGEKRES
jgi:hypothetical protein